MKNLELWNAVKTAPQEALKKIVGGRLKGMSDISPMWRYMELTKHFGPCGVGWKYTIDKLWIEQGFGDNIAAFANITLYVKYDGIWSEGIPGNGGSMLAAKESGGVHTSDECFKMATTDALSVACKMLGMAADVYWFAGSKYSEVEEQKQPVKPDPKQAQRDLYKKIDAAIDGALSMVDIDSVANAYVDDIETLPEAGQKALADKLDKKRAEIAGAAFQ